MRWRFWIVSTPMADLVAGSTWIVSASWDTL